MKEIQAKSSRQVQLTVFLLKVVHFTVTLALFYLFWLLFRYHSLNVARVRGYRYNYFVLLAYAALIQFFNNTYNSYLLGYLRIRSIVFAQFISQVFSTVLVYLIVSVAWDHFDNPLIFFVLLTIQLLFDCGWSYYANLCYFRLNPARKTILIYRNELDLRRFGTIEGKPTERLYQITRKLQYAGNSFAEIRHELEGFDAVFVAGIHSRCRNGILKYCEENNIPGFFLPHVGDVLMQGAVHVQSFDSPVMLARRRQVPMGYAIFKRLFDIAFSLFGLIILSPLMLVVALAIRLHDHGPAIYKQVRLTKDAKQFEIYKFRSMRVDAEKDGVARLSTGDQDDRVTPIGRVIRRCRLDELPQLINILKGDMSFVGPRPERPEISEQYLKVLPDFNLRLQVKAGLTGYAQVYGKYNIDPYEKLQFDLLYINHMNVFTDLQLVFATFGILFSRESTEGIRGDSVSAHIFEEDKA